MPTMTTGTDSATRTIAPGPRGTVLLGSLPEMRRQGQIQFYLDAWRRFGDVVRLRLGPLTAHLIVQPEHIRHVLVANRDNYRKGIAYRKVELILGAGLFTSEGDLWRRQRRLMQPPFTPGGVKRFTGAITECSAQMLERWQTAAERGQEVDIQREMMRLTMSIIGKTMFSVDVHADAGVVGPAFSAVLEFAAARTVALLDVPLFIPTPMNRRFKEALRTLDAFIYGVIAERRGREDDQEDLLSLLLRARDEETGQGMSERQLRDEVLTIFFAGHETTAQALTWAWYLLSQHPAAERRLHTELATVLGGRAPTAQDLPGLTYTRMVIEEAMRLYPPVWMFARDAIAHDEIGGYHVPAGSMILMSQYLAHRHPAYWEHPEAFDPERFTPERSAGRPHYAYFPFGGGQRTCIGNHFAMLEAQLILATVAQRYRPRLAPGQAVEPVAVGTLRPRHGLWMTLHQG